MRLFNKKALLDNPGKTEVQIFRKKLLDYIFKSFTQIEWGENAYRWNGIVVLRLEEKGGKIRGRFFYPASPNKPKENSHYPVGKTAWVEPGDDATKLLMACRDHLREIEDQFGCGEADGEERAALAEA